MGIQGFLQYIKRLGAGKTRRVKELRGQTAAFDGFAILHRYAVSDAKNVALRQYSADSPWMHGALSYIRSWSDSGVRIVLVFDGDAVPCKEIENSQRRERREEALSSACSGSGSQRDWMAAVSVTQEMVDLFVSTARKQFPCVAVVRSPFEADAQLAYVVRSGLADFAVAEDSDLLIFGCPRLCTRFDREQGTVVEYTLTGLEQFFDWGTGLHFRRRLLYFAVLCGCDYLPSRPGVGPVTARLVIDSLCPRGSLDALGGLAGAQEDDVITRFLKSGQTSVPLPKKLLQFPFDEEYSRQFRRALVGFRAHWVFCPQTCRVMPLEAAVATRGGRETENGRCEELAIIGAPSREEIEAELDFIGRPRDAEDFKRDCVGLGDIQAVQAPRGTGLPSATPPLPPSRLISSSKPQPLPQLLSSLIEQGRSLSRSSTPISQPVPLAAGDSRLPPLADAPAPLSIYSSPSPSPLADRLSQPLSCGLLPSSLPALGSM